MFTRYRTTVIIEDKVSRDKLLNLGILTRSATDTFKPSNQVSRYLRSSITLADGRYRQHMVLLSSVKMSEM